MNTKNITTTIALILIIIALLITSYFSYQYFLLSNNSKNSDTVEDVIKNENVGTEINEVEETNNDTSNLTTYSNSEYGIEFMYPKDYPLVESISEFGNLNIILQRGNMEGFKILIEKNNLTSNDVVNENIITNENIKIGKYVWEAHTTTLPHSDNYLGYSLFKKIDNKQIFIVFGNKSYFTKEKKKIVESITIK